MGHPPHHHRPLNAQFAPGCCMQIMTGTAIAPDRWLNHGCSVSEHSAPPMQCVRAVPPQGLCAVHTLHPWIWHCCTHCSSPDYEPWPHLVNISHHPHPFVCKPAVRLGIHYSQLYECGERTLVQLVSVCPLSHSNMIKIYRASQPN